MPTDVTIPTIGESITEGTILVWLVEVGERVEVDQPLLELETDKVTAELPAPVAGVLTEQLFAAGEDVDVGAVVGRIAEGAAASSAPAESPAEASTEKGPPLSPAVRRLIDEHGLDSGAISATGKGGRLLKGDVLAFLKPSEEPPPTEPEPAADPDIGGSSAIYSTLASIPIARLEEELRGKASQLEPAKEPATPKQPAAEPTPAPPAKARSTMSSARSSGAGRGERRVRMTRMRRAIARRLKEVQNTAAILTTFNEVDMSATMALRSRYKEAFLTRHGVKLGFMSFFVKATVEALKEHPAVNGSIDGDDLVYHETYDIGVAVSTETGLVVPVIRDADRLSFAEVEQTIRNLAGAAREGSLSLEQLTGGTFSITNGGVFGSMLSTPILNPPQSGILGMHNIVRRPVAVGDQVEIRPVMYLALSYDHRIVDGSQAVRFLVKIKEIIEDPARLLLET